VCSQASTASGFLILALKNNSIKVLDNNLVEIPAFQARMPEET